MPNQTQLYPPGPLGRRFLGVTGDLAYDRRPHFMRQLAYEYGGIARVRVPLRRYVFLVSHPDYIKHVLVTRQRNYRKGLSPQKLWYGNSLAVAEGEYHLGQRRLLQPHFHRRQVEGYGDIVTDLTQQHIAQWRDGQQVDLLQEILELTSAIMIKILLGMTVQKGQDDMVKAFKGLIEDLLPSDLTPIGQWIHKLPNARHRRNRANLAILDAAMYAAIRACRQNPGAGEDMLSLLVQARYEDGTGMSDRQIRDELINIYIAGHETIALAIVWTFYHLMQYPALEAQVAAEARAVTAGRPPTVADRPNLPQVRRVLAETMRIMPPVWHNHARIALEEDEIGGYYIPAGSTLLILPLVMHHHPDYWEEPDAFILDRFDETRYPPPNPYVYIPFGAGPRKCIGEPLAWLEGELVVATVLAQMGFRLPEGSCVQPNYYVLTRPRGGLPAVVQRR